MKKHAFLITSTLSAMLLLAACNSTENPTPNTEKETTGTVNEQTDTQNGATEGKDTTVDTTPEDTNTIEYVENGQTKEAEATVTTSPEQNYKILLAKGFSLEAEEPGRDMLMYDANEEYSMRIETFAKDETTYEEMALQTENTVAITAPEGKYEEYALDSFLATYKDILNAKGYIVHYTEDEDQVVTIIFEKEAKIVRLTIFDKIPSEMTNAFLQMGFTIE